MELKDLKEKQGYVLVSDINISKDGDYFTLKEGNVINCYSIYTNGLITFYYFSYIKKGDGETISCTELMSFTDVSIGGLLKIIEPQEITPTTPTIEINELDYYKNYNIPKEIKLASTKVKVVFKELNNNLSEEALMIDGVHFGNATYITNTIELQIPRFKVIQYDVKHTYYHELLHWIFYITGKINLNDDEGFIDLASNLLSQAMENN